ncbi:VOC family protein [Microvirga sp. M2]|uniref:VOC family protein n=1 Tax=Microvirga sp. M2 TaxID=3073270 RepID=UPI0039C2EA34
MVQSSADDQRRKVSSRVSTADLMYATDVGLLRTSRPQPGLDSYLAMASCWGGPSFVMVASRRPALAHFERRASTQEMIMEIDSLNHVALPCTDLERSRQFYQEVFGLVEIPRPAPPCPADCRSLVPGRRSPRTAFGCW